MVLTGCAPLEGGVVGKGCPGPAAKLGAWDLAVVAGHGAHGLQGAGASSLRGLETTLRITQTWVIAAPWTAALPRAPALVVRRAKEHGEGWVTLAGT